MIPKIVTAPKITTAWGTMSDKNPKPHAFLQLTKLNVSEVTGNENGEIMTAKTMALKNAAAT